MAPVDYLDDVRYYRVPDIGHEAEYQCISPKKRDKICTNRNNKKDRDDIAWCVGQLPLKSSPEARRPLIREILIKRICLSNHREDAELKHALMDFLVSEYEQKWIVAHQSASTRQEQDTTSQLGLQLSEEAQAIIDQARRQNWHHDDDGDALEDDSDAESDLSDGSSIVVEEGNNTDNTQYDFPTPSTDPDVLVDDQVDPFEVETRPQDSEASSSSSDDMFDLTPPSTAQNDEEEAPFQEDAMDVSLPVDAEPAVTEEPEHPEDLEAAANLQPSPQFEPYKEPPAENSGELRDIFTRPVEPEKVGWVYAFCWPTAPGHVKIGRTERSPYERLKEWRRHHPGAYMVDTLPCRFPKRFEDLIHAQLAQYRRRLIRCAVCSERKKKNVSHIEWFDISEQVARETFQLWRNILDNAEVYRHDGQICTHWESVARRASMDRELLEYLKQETDPNRVELLAQTTHTPSQLFPILEFAGKSPESDYLSVLQNLCGLGIGLSSVCYVLITIGRMSVLQNLCGLWIILHFGLRCLRTTA